MSATAMERGPAARQFARHDIREYKFDLSNTAPMRAAEDDTMAEMQLGTATYQAILFDFNGVLLLDSPWHEAAWHETLEELTQRSWSRQQITSLIHGRTNRDIFEQVCGRQLVQEEQERLSELKESRYRAICGQKGAAFALAPGVPALLDRLRAEGVLFTIATASGEINMRFYYQELGLQRWFDWDAIAYDDGTIRGKPAPDIYLRAAQRLGVAPRQAVVVEDSLAGMRAARNAGTGFVVAVGDTQALPASDPLFDVKLDSLADFTHLF